MVCDCSIICATQQVVVLNNKIVLHLPSENEWPLGRKILCIPASLHLAGMPSPNENTAFWLHQACKTPITQSLPYCGSHFKREFLTNSSNQFFKS